MSHPDTLNIRNGHKMHRWHDLNAQVIQNLIWEGDPAAGWSGDPNMLLMRDAGGWIVVTLEKVASNGANLQYYVVMRERAGEKADLRQLTHMLALRDTHMRDVEAERIKKNELAEAVKDAEYHDKAMDAMDEVLFYVRKETASTSGHTSTRFM